MNHNGDCLGEKGVYSYDNTNGNIGKWVNSFRNDANKDKIGFMSNKSFFASYFRPSYIHDSWSPTA